MNFDKMNEDKKSSIKCHLPPGGIGNFSIGWGSDEVPKRVRTHQRSDSNSDYNIITGEAFQVSQISTVKVSDKENSNQMNIEGKILPCLNRDTKSQSIKTKYDNGKKQFNIFEGSNTTVNIGSMKVNQTAGGNSSINFGNDNSSYEEYRRKR